MTGGIDEATLRVSAEGGAGADLPQYATGGASGMDIRARLAAPVVLPPGGRALIPTGLSIELPEGYEAQVRARSGLAAKHGIGLVNGVGTIDSDYRGEILVCLINWGDEDFMINDGDRVAQLVVARYSRVVWERVGAASPAGDGGGPAGLSATERGAGGFGHTGV